MGRPAGNGPQRLEQLEEERHLVPGPAGTLCLHGPPRPQSTPGGRRRQPESARRHR